MSRRARRPPCLLVAAYLVALALAVPAAGAVLKHKTSGETIRGTLTEQRINRKNVFELEGGGMKLIEPDEWDVIEADAAPEPEPAADPAENAADPAAESDATEADAEAAVKRAYVIPIHGPIESHALVEALLRAIGEARDAKASVVVFELNTPGGRVDLADKIIRNIEAIDFAETVAWVHGEDRQALSAGAYICLATHRIYMTPGATLGAATPFRRTIFGSPEVDEKFKSAFRARFRALAQTRGHPAALADAMVDASVTVVEVTLDGKRKLVSYEEARQLEREHKGDKAFRRGKTLCGRGRILTLTTQEAVDYGVCKGTPADVAALSTALEIPPAEVRAAEWMDEWVATEAAAREKAVQDHLNAYRHHLRLAMQSDPHENLYRMTVNMNGRFRDGGQLWRSLSDRCLAHLKACAKSVVELERMGKDERYAFQIDENLLSRFKTEMNAIYNRVLRERNAKVMP